MNKIDNKTECDFCYEENLNASLTCSLVPKEDLEEQYLSFATSEIKINGINQTIYIPKLSQINLIYKNENENSYQSYIEKTENGVETTQITKITTIIEIIKSTEMTKITEIPEKTEIVTDKEETDITPIIQNKPFKKKSNNNNGLIIGLCVGGGIILLSILAAIIFYRSKLKKSKMNYNNNNNITEQNFKSDSNLQN